MPVRRYNVTVANQTKVVVIDDAEGALRVTVDGVERTLDVRAAGGRLTWLEGTQVITAEVEGTAPKLSVAVGSHVLAAEVVDAQAAALAAAARAAGPSGPTHVRAPMPGRVVKVLVRAGDSVKAGQGLMVVEAMKMENEIRAPREGRVKEIRVAEGAAVEPAQDLITLE